MRPRRHDQAGGADLLDALPLAALLVDGSGRVSRANALAGALLESPAGGPVGLEARTVLGRDLQRRDDDAGPRRWWTEITGPGGAVRVEVHVGSNQTVPLLASEPGSTLVLLVPEPAEARRGQTPPVREWQDIARRVGFIDGDATCLLIGLVGLDTVNADHSRSMGDEVLAAVQRRLVQRYPKAVVERVSSECFAVIAGSDRLSVADAEVVNALVRAPIDVPLARVAVGCAIGVAHGDAASGLVLLDKAQRSLDAALRRGPGSIVSQPPDRNSRGEKLSEVAGALVDAVSHGRIGAHFQPVVDLWTGEVVEYEALARWAQDPEETLAATSFIGAAALTGVITSIATDILTAAEQLGEVLGASPRHLDTRVSMNITVRELLDDTIPDQLFAVLDRMGRGPGTLQVEIPALIAPDLITDVAERVDALRHAGVRVALDGFGGPASSAWLLRALRLDAVKLAASLLDGLDGDPVVERFLWSLMTMARDVNVDVIAKGVETEAHHKALRRLGCRYAQGYYYGAPRAADMLDADTLGPRCAPDLAGGRFGRVPGGRESGRGDGGVVLSSGPGDGQGALRVEVCASNSETS